MSNYERNWLLFILAFIAAWVVGIWGLSTTLWLIFFMVLAYVWRSFLLWAQDRYFPAPPEPEEEDNAEIEDERAWMLTGYKNVLMWRTQRGKAFLDRVAKRNPNLWNFFGNLGLVIVFGVMVLMMALLLWQATLVPRIPKESAPSPKLLIGLPGLNPVIPLWYGILALAIAMVIHEFCHGILARVGKIRVKTMGLVFFIFPIGAFMEPDEEEMMAMPRRSRMRLYAAGPTSNIILAVLLAIVFCWGFMASAEPVENGALIRSVSVGDDDGFEYPAERAGIEPWMLIVEVDDGSGPVTISNTDDFSDFMEGTYAGQNITVVVLEEGKRKAYEDITLVDKGDYWLKYYPDDYEPEMAGQGFLGVSTSNPEEITDWLAHPLQEHGDWSRLRGFLLFITLPFQNLQPFPDTFTDLYEPTGALGIMPDGMFWLLANILYWVFWLNLMVGLTNALPAQPLDGGFIFADGLTELMEKIKGTALSEDQKENVVGWATVVLTFGILGLLLFQIVGPRVIGAEVETYDAEFETSNDMIVLGETITFDASPSEGDFVRFGWNFGDNTTAEGLEVSHTYQDPGSYIVVLTAYTDENDQSLAGDKVAVNLDHADDDNNLGAGQSHTYSFDAHSKAESLTFEGEVNYGAGDRGQITLNTPADTYTQNFNNLGGGTATFNWEVSDDGPGYYELEISNAGSSVSDVSFTYTVVGEF